MSASCWWFIESSNLLLLPLQLPSQLPIPNLCQQEQQSWSKLYPPPMDCARDGRAVFDPRCRLASWLSLSPGSPGDPSSQQSLLPCRSTAFPDKGPAVLASCPAPRPSESKQLPGAVSWLPAGLALSPAVAPGSPACGCPGPSLINPRALVSHHSPELLVGPSPSH